MPLRWDVEQVRDFETRCFITLEDDMPMRGLSKGDEVLNPITHALIWHCMNVGIGSITDEIAAEFYVRVSIVESLHGANVIGPNGPEPITSRDVFEHIGLHTNARGKVESRASFLKRQAEIESRVTAVEKDMARMARMAGV